MPEALVVRRDDIVPDVRQVQIVSAPPGDFKVVAGRVENDASRALNFFALLVLGCGWFTSVLRVGPISLLVGVILILAPERLLPLGRGRNSVEQAFQTRTGI